MLLKGIVEGDTVAKYYLLFRNAVLESGTLEEMELAIERIVREGKADLARFLERWYAMKTGTGGGYKYLGLEPSTKIVAQEEANSCVAACVRYYLDYYFDIILKESTVRKLLGTKKGGTNFDNALGVLQKKIPMNEYEGGLLKMMTREEAIMFIKNLSETTDMPWIAQVRGVKGGRAHAVVVENIIDDIVKISDPWNLERGFGIGLPGSKGTMRLDDFITHWEWGRNGSIWYK